MRKYIFKLKYIIFIKIATALISIIGLASMPYILKLLFDYDHSKGYKGIILLIGAYACAISVGMLFEYISQRHAWKLEQHYNILVKQDLFDSILSKSYIQFKRNEISDYVSIFSNDLKTSEQYLESIVAIIQTIFQLLVYGFFLYTLDYRLAIIIIVSSSLSLFLPRITGSKLAEKKGTHLSAMASYIDMLIDLLSGFRFVNDETRKSISKQQKNTLIDTENKLYAFGKFKTFANILSGSSMYFLEIIVISSIGLMLFNEIITMGTAVAALGYIQSFCYPMAYLLKEINNVNSSRSAKDKLNKLLNEEIHPKPRLQEFRSTIKFEDVSITLGDFTLKNFSFEFHKGKKYAIIGPSGVGKSTILSLLMQYIHPDHGEILIDNMPIRNFDTSNLMTCINQIEHTFNSSFIENATIFGSYSEINVENTMKYFNNEKMYSIRKKENARDLSGGEKQMLHLIRSVSMDKEILLFDEAFSAIDQENSIKLQQALLLMDKTVILITHDVSDKCLSGFDEIVTIKKR